MGEDPEIYDTDEDGDDPGPLEPDDVVDWIDDDQVWNPDGSLNPERPRSDSCVWGPDCRRERGLHCPSNCIWIHEQYETYPRCVGHYGGEGLISPDHPERAIARKHCQRCIVREDCLARTTRSPDAEG